jgi:hypothetical protein
MAKISQVLVVCLLMMSGCSGGTSFRLGGVAHAGGFNISTLTGTYALSGQSTTFESQGAHKIALVGFVALDGNGKITSGSITQANEQLIAICTYSLAGTYSVNADGTGTATMVALNIPGSCTDETRTFALALSSGGTQVNFVETTLTNSLISSGVLFKQ